MVPIPQSAFLVLECTPHGTCSHANPAGTDLFPPELSEVPLDLAASHHLRMNGEKILEQGRAAAAIATDIDELCQR